MKSIRVRAPERHPKIVHLSDECINQMIDDYYDGVSIKEIIKKNNIELKASAIVKLFPPIVLEDKECIYCHVKLWEKLESKGSRQYYYLQRKPYCPKCGHIEDVLCNCINCKNQAEINRIEENRKVKESIYEFYNLSNLVPLRLEDLSFQDRIFLGTLLRTGLSEDKKYLRINDFQDAPIAPSFEMFLNMLDSLTSQNIIVIHPDSPPEAFLNLNDIRNSETDFKRVLYHVNIADFYTNEVVQSLIFPEIFLECYKQELMELWRTIALEECKTYLQYSLNYVDFPYNVGEKAQIIFNNLLSHFSVAQIFGLIGRCLGYTTREFQGGKLTRFNGGAYLLGAIQNQGDRAIANKWNLTKYSRPKLLPESQLSSFLFNSFLKFSEPAYCLLISTKEIFSID